MFIMRYKNFVINEIWQFFFFSKRYNVTTNGQSAAHNCA